MRTSFVVSSVCAMFLSGVLDQASLAQESDDEWGLRGSVLLGDGKPANDFLGAGVFGRHFLANGWFVGASVDAFRYDFKGAAAHLGIRQDPSIKVIDADGSIVAIGGFFGREYGDANNGFRWFWSLGLGIGLQDVDAVTGPIAGGGTFELVIDADNDLQILGAVGTSYFFNANWSVSFSARLEHHFMNVRIADRVTGTTTKIDGQTPIGGYLSLNYRF